MVGFIKGLFGSRQSSEASVVRQPEPTSKASQAKDSFFLDTDDAKTLGNLDYMRTVKSVRRTFPKTVNNDEIELNKAVSAMEERTAPATGQTGSTSEPQTSVSQPPVQPAAERRRADSGMDIFRNMAKDIKKKP